MPRHPLVPFAALSAALFALAPASAAPVPKAAKADTPTLRLAEGSPDGRSRLRLELVNPTSAAVPYDGYTPESFDGGMAEGVIAPRYRVEVKRDGEWVPQKLGWCKTGAGPVSVPAGGRGGFAADVPPGEWDEARLGVDWFAGAERRRETVWVTVSREKAGTK